MADNQTFIGTPKPAGARESGGPTAPGAFTTIGRSVLPRIEREGTAVRLIHEDKERYESLGNLGDGGMGEVRRVMDHDIGREVAIKRLHSHLQSGGGVSRFVSEIRTVGSLEHPNIVPIHDVGRDADGNYFFVMKRLEGLTVEAIIAGLRTNEPAMRARFTIDARLAIVRGVLHALEYAHARGVVHRDVKPANVMVGPFGEVVLMDWGIAKAVAAPEGLSAGTDELPAVNLTGTRMGTMIGTPAYMSPEQFRGEIDKIDARSDLYAVGVMLYELLTLSNAATGRPDVEAVKRLVLARESAVDEANVALEPGVGFDLQWLCWRATHRDPGQRFESARAMLDEMDRIASGLCRVDCAFTALKRASGASTRAVDTHPFAAMAAVVTFAASFGVVSVFAAVLALR